MYVCRQQTAGAEFWKLYLTPVYLQAWGVQAARQGLPRCGRLPCCLPRRGAFNRSVTVSIPFIGDGGTIYQVYIRRKVNRANKKATGRVKKNLFIGKHTTNHGSRLYDALLFQIYLLRSVLSKKKKKIPILCLCGRRLGFYQQHWHQPAPQPGGAAVRSTDSGSEGAPVSGGGG